MEVSLTLTDPALIAKLDRAARKDKAQDFGRWAADLFLKAARQHLGMDAGLTVGEAATRLQCHKNTVRNYIRTERLDARIYTDRTVRITAKSVEALEKRAK